MSSSEDLEAKNQASSSQELDEAGGDKKSSATAETSNGEENLNESKDLESDDEEEKKVGIFEQPLIKEGKRQRKKTEFLTESIDKEIQQQEQKKEVVVPEGKGTPLGDIPFISAMLTRKKTEDLSLLHRMVFGVVGQAVNRRRNLRKFNGFAFEKDSKEYKKKEDFISRCFVSALKELCEIFGLERGGTKEVLQERVLEFVMKPENKGKAVPTPKHKRKSGGGKSSSAKKKEPKAKKTKKEKSSSEQVDDESEDEDESDDAEESDEPETPPKKETKKKDTPKKTSAKKSKPPKKESEETKESASDDDDDDDVPLKQLKPPTDEQLRGVVKKIINKANLEEVTMKTVCQQVYDKYPGFNLTPRKDFIKGAVKELLRQC